MRGSRATTTVAAPVNGLVLFGPRDSAYCQAQARVPGTHDRAVQRLATGCCWTNGISSDVPVPCSFLPCLSVDHDDHAALSILAYFLQSVQSS